MTLVFAVGHGEEDEIPKRLIPLIIVSTWLTHLFGGSAGREGVAVQLGAAVFGSATSTLLGPILIGCEVFGFAYLPYFSLVCLTAFVLKRDRSIYGAQKVMDYQNMTLHFPKF